MEMPSLYRYTALVGLPLAVLAWLLWPASLPPAAAQSGAELPQPIDVFFLIDDSNCMAGATLNHMDSIDAIAAGLDAVLAQLDPERDRAALVGFGDEAEAFSPLTNDWDQLRTDLQKVTMRDGMARLDLAYLEVATMLREGDAREGALVVTIVVTDGPMMQAPQLATARARDLRTRFGVRHYNIAVGTIAQFALLREIAEPGGFWTLPFGGDLIAAYQKASEAIVALSYLAPAPIPTRDPADPGTATPEPMSAQGYLPSLWQR
jgi:hypothetical protein